MCYVCCAVRAMRGMCGVHRLLSLSLPLHLHLNLRMRLHGNQAVYYTKCVCKCVLRNMCRRLSVG